MLNTDEEKIILGTSLTYYRCNPEFIEPEYLLFFMRSQEFILQYQAVMTKSTRNQVPITKQREFFHLIPPISIQRKIIPLLNELKIAVESLEKAYSSKIYLFDELKKSLLHKAFAGELT